MIYWILRHTGKWHAWERGANKSLCGTITEYDLRMYPAKDIYREAALPAGHVRCMRCTNKMTPTQIAACLVHENNSPEVNDWIGLIRRHLAHKRVSLAKQKVVALAQRLAKIGTPQEPKARIAYERIKALLLTPRFRRVNSGSYSRNLRVLPEVAQVIELLPLEDEQAMQKVVTTLTLWQKITKRNVAHDNGRPAQIVKTILDVQQPEAYIEHLAGRGIDHLAAVFHPNTFNRAKKETSLRGAFDKDGAEYWEELKGQLNVVSDDE